MTHLLRRFMGYITRLNASDYGLGWLRRYKIYFITLSYNTLTDFAEIREANDVA